MAQQEPRGEPGLAPPTPVAVAVAELIELLKQGKVEEFNKARPTKWYEPLPGRPKQRCFTELDLSGQDFSGLDLRGVNLASTVLRGANFSGADLRGANFSFSDVNGAKFDRAKTRGARFRRVEGMTNWLREELAAVNVEGKRKERIDAPPGF